MFKIVNVDLYQKDCETNKGGQNIFIEYKIEREGFSIRIKGLFFLILVENQSLWCY